MLAKPLIFITVPYSILKDEFEIEYEREICINILIDSVEIDLSILKNCISKFENQFVFSISGALLNSNSFSKLLPSLYMLFVLSSCETLRQGVIPVFLEADDHLQNLEILKDHFLINGEVDISFDVIKPGEKNKGNFLFFDIEYLQAFDENDINIYSNQEVTSVIIQLHFQLSIQEAIAYIKTVVAKNNFLKFFLNLTVLKRENKWLLHQDQLWQERAKLYLSFISIGKQVGEHEQNTLKQWYYQEYEVLPLWYKRFGHILKFIKGKRKFKSFLK